MKGMSSIKKPRLDVCAQRMSRFSRNTYTTPRPKQPDKNRVADGNSGMEHKLEENSLSNVANSEVLSRYIQLLALLRKPLWRLNDFFHS